MGSTPGDTRWLARRSRRVTAVEIAATVIERIQPTGSALGLRQFPRFGKGKLAPSVRWALTQMVEVTSRHAGHAGILRERIDGATGR